MNFRPFRFAMALVLLAISLSGCSKPEEKAAQYIKRGNELFDEGKLEKARVEYKNAGRIKPTDPEIAYRMALIDEAEGDFRGAYEGYNIATQQDAHFHPALLKLAEYYLAGDHFDEVSSRIEIVLADNPNDAEGHALRAALLLRQKDYSGTEKEARTALDRDPKNVSAFSVLAGLYTAQGDDTKALGTIEQGLAQNPKNLPLLLLKAEVYERQKDYPKLDDTYKLIFSLAPSDVRYRVNLAAIYLRAGRLDDAEATLRDSVAALPDNWDMKRELVAFLADHRGLDAAEKEVNSLIKDYPGRAELTSWLVDLYVSHGATDRAIALLNDIIARNELDERGLDARTALARINYIKGDRDAAEKLADAVLEKDPNNIDARFVMARVEFDKGFYHNAVTDLRIIIRDQPKAKEALHLLSETLLMQGHLDLAIDTLSELVDIDPLNYAARVRLAQMLHQNGDSRRAMDMLFLVTKTDPKYPVGWESTARIAIDLKNFDTAETAIHTLDTLDGQHLTATYLQGQLLEKSGKPEDAIAQYTQVIDADPTSPIAEHALTALVADYQRLGRLDDATRYIESLKSKNAVVSTILGESYLVSGKPQNAAADFDSAIGDKTRRPEPYLDRARMYLDEHKTDDALATLKKGAEAAPSDMRAPLMQAEILGQLGRYQEAIALYDNILARNPDLDAVANNLAEIIADYEYTDPAALDKAKHVAERFVATSNPFFLDTLGWIYYRQGNIEEAQNVIKRAMAMPNLQLPPQAHYHFGAILLKANKVPEAKAELQKATVPGANYPGLDDAKEMLLGL
jgi:tetratricopeptide (TPR) repeat protein